MMTQSTEPSLTSDDRNKFSPSELNAGFNSAFYSAEPIIKIDLPIGPSIARVSRRCATCQDPKRMAPYLVRYSKFMTARLCWKCLSTELRAMVERLYV